MKQVLQHLRSGQIELAEVPCPQIKRGHLLVQTSHSLISSGTERSLVEFSKAGLIAKARAQPDKVRQVFDKIKVEGLFPTLEVVFSRLEEPLPLGYCNVGTVVEVGPGVTNFSVGDRVASNGAHAEMICVPSTLATRVPDNVSDEAATFTVLGAIALHGIRLMQPTLGESFVVVGLGLLGLTAVQLLRANGCHVLGIDVNPKRCELARTFGCETVAIGDGVDPVRSAEGFSEGRGVDGVLITASSKSDEIIHQATQMCRKRGRIVMVGVVGMNLRRSDFYEKELSLQVSCSYGPGRYDAGYEQKTQDYPLPYVRWTVARNFEAVLLAAASGSLDLEPLVSRRFKQADAQQAYEGVLKDDSILGVILEYPRKSAPLHRVVRLSDSHGPASHPMKPVVGVIGTGSFSRLVLLPAIKATGATIHTVVSARGITSVTAGRKFEGLEASTDVDALLANAEVNTIFVATRHDSHASIVVQALAAGKHVFVEKPLAIDEDGLAEIRDAHRSQSQLQLMVGFNRRFAPHTLRAKQLLAGRSQPLALTMTVNAGNIPSDHWVHDLEVGGGRIIGEACHFLDLLMHLVGSPITSIAAVMFGPTGGGLREDKMSLNMTFGDGSIGSVQYYANGGKSFPKERVEIFSEGRVLLIDNWRRLRAFDWPGAGKLTTRQDKGHKTEVAAFLDRVDKGGDALIPFEQLDLVTRATFAAVRSAREGVTIPLSTLVETPHESVEKQTARA